MAQCPSCGATSAEGSGFCASCGTSLSAMDSPGGTPTSQTPPPYSPAAPPQPVQQPPKKRGGCLKWLGVAVLLLVALIIIVVVASGGGDGTAEDNSGTTAAGGTATTAQEEDGTPSVGLNEEVRVGDVGWIVTAVKTTDKLESGNEFIEPKTTTGQFVWVDVIIKNYGSDALTADSSAVHILDSQDREFGAYAESFAYIAEDKQLFLEQINPGLDRTGQIIFEIPKDATGLRLSVGDLDFISSDQGLIDLGI